MGLYMVRYCILHFFHKQQEMFPVLWRLAVLAAVLLKIQASGM
jgi:hypothetical protein